MSEVMIFLLPGTYMVPFQFCLQEATPDYASPALTPFSSELPQPLLPGYVTLHQVSVVCPDIVLVTHAHFSPQLHWQLGPHQFDQHSLHAPSLLVLTTSLPKDFKSSDS